jgi:hypothetical protein
MSGDTKIDTGCFNHDLEQVLLKDLDSWRCNHLSENRTVKRKKYFALRWHFFIGLHTLPGGTECAAENPHSVPDGQCH